MEKRDILRNLGFSTDFLDAVEQYEEAADKPYISIFGTELPEIESHDVSSLVLHSVKTYVDSHVTVVSE